MADLPAVEAEVAWGLVSLAISRPRAPADEALRPLLRSAAPVYFVLDVGNVKDGGSAGKRWQVTAEHFLTRTLGRLLTHLSRNLEKERVTCRERLRGPIDWPATSKARLIRPDPAQYLCNLRRRELDLPENQLLRFLLVHLTECIARVPEVVRAGCCCLAARDSGGPHRARLLATSPRLAAMEAVLQTCRREALLRHVSLPGEIGEVHLARAESSRLGEYRDLARLFRRFWALTTRPAWADLVGISRRVLPLPARDDAAGNPWLHLGAALLSGGGQA